MRRAANHRILWLANHAPRASYLGSTKNPTTGASGFFSLRQARRLAAEIPAAHVVRPKLLALALALVEHLEPAADEPPVRVVRGARFGVRVDLARVQVGLGLFDPAHALVLVAGGLVVFVLGRQHGGRVALAVNATTMLMPCVCVTTT